MKYQLEIQSEGFNINTDEIINLVKKSLRRKKVSLTKLKDLRIYYVTETKIVYYICEYDGMEVSGHIYTI